MARKVKQNKAGETQPLLTFDVYISKLTSKSKFFAKIDTSEERYLYKSMIYFGSIKEQKDAIIPTPKELIFNC